MGAPFRFLGLDSLYNLISRLGTDAAKNPFNRYGYTALDQAQLTSAYRGDWIARKIVDIPVHDAVREWRDWQAEDDQITLIEAEEKRLGIQRQVLRAMLRGRLYGGGIIVMGIGNDQPEQPLNIDTVRQGSLRYATVLGRWEVSTPEKETDVESPWYGHPKWYEINSTSAAVRVHPSRVVRFLGNEYPDLSLAPDIWSDSVLQAVDDAVKHAGLAMGGIAELIHDAKVDNLSIPGLSEKIATDAYEQALSKRLTYYQQMKSLVGVSVTDSDETVTRTQTSFANLPDLLRAYLQVASGAADIPATRMLGQAPSGLNSTGDSDVRNYYDNIASRQENDLTPSIATLNEVLIRSALGDRPPEIYYTWAPLWQMDAKDKAEVGYKRAQTVEIYARNSLVPSVALEEATQNMLIESGDMPGLEAALQKAGVAEEVPNVDPETGEPMADAAPRTLYVRRDVVNASDIVAWAKAQGFKSIVPASSMHVTIAFSRTPVDWMEAGESGHWAENDKGQIVVKPGGARVVEALGDKGAVVLMFNSSALSWRHEEICEEAGASWDYEEYQPHCTITWDAGGLDLEKVVPYRGEIVLGPEIFEPVDENWASKIGEVSTVVDAERVRPAA